MCVTLEPDNRVDLDLEVSSCEYVRRCVGVKSRMSLQCPDRE